MARHRFALVSKAPEVLVEWKAPYFKETTKATKLYLWIFLILHVGTICSYYYFYGPSDFLCGLKVEISIMAPSMKISISFINYSKKANVRFTYQNLSVGHSSIMP